MKGSYIIDPIEQVDYRSDPIANEHTEIISNTTNHLISIKEETYIRSEG